VHAGRVPGDPQTGRRAAPIPSSPSRPRASNQRAARAVPRARGPVTASSRRRARLTPFVAAAAALAIAGGLIAWALTERSGARQSRSDARSSELRASGVSRQLRATTGRLRESQATVGILNHKVASLASEKARIAHERQRLRQIVADAAKEEHTEVAHGCLDSSSDFADARVVGALNARNNVDFYFGVDGTCSGGVRRRGRDTMVVARSEAAAARICTTLGATSKRARFASFGYPVPGTWWLCA